MNVLIATDKFKDSLTAAEAAAAMAAGVHKAAPFTKIVQLPLSDGGDGFARMAANYAGAKLIAVEVSGPLQQGVIAHYAWLPRYKRAYIEMAEAAGLHLLPPHLRSPLNTTTHGVGELIKHALAKGAKEIYLGIGGSATQDVGVGMAAALGYHFLDSSGRPFLPTGGSLQQIARIATAQAHKGLQEAKFYVACDVTNPLLGPGGATYTYATQKGAQNSQLPFLEKGVEHLAQLLEYTFGQTLGSLPGGGAAGGLGVGALAFLGASLLPGANMVLELAGFAQKAEEADLIITGEGQTDQQSVQGKVAGVIAQQAHQFGKPLLLLCGALGLSTRKLSKAGFWHSIAISPPGEALEKSLLRSEKRLVAAAYTGTKLFLEELKKPH